MRRIQDHSRATRRLLAALVLAYTCIYVTTGAAFAAGDRTPTARTPLTAFESFRFEFDFTVSAGPDRPGFDMHITGFSKGQRAQDCEATVSLGGLDITRRAVVVGNSTWIDDGDGLKKAARREFDWEGECPSSPEFWADFPYRFPTDLEGTTESRDGTVVERVDLSSVMSHMGGLIDDMPDDVTIDRAIVWQSKRHGFLVGLDLAFGGQSESTCREILELESDATAPQTCSMTIRLDLSRFDDEKIEVTGGRGPNGRVIRT